MRMCVYVCVCVCMCVCTRRPDQLRDERRGVLVRQPVLPTARPQAHVRNEPANHVPARPGRARVRGPLRGRRALGMYFRRIHTCLLVFVPARPDMRKPGTCYVLGELS